MDINSFYDTTGVATFLDKMSAFLGVTTDRLKIVGIYNGSTNVVFMILPATLVPTDQSMNHAPDSDAITTELKSLALKITDSITTGIPGLQSYSGSDVSVTIINSNGEKVVEPDNTPAPPDAEPSNTTRYIIIGVVVGVAGATLLGLAIYLIISKLRSRNMVSAEESGVEGDDSKDVVRSNNKSEV